MHDATPIGVALAGQDASMNREGVRFSPKLRMASCFMLIGIAHLASLWFESYRLVTMSLVASCFLIATGNKQRSGHWSALGKGLLPVAPVYLYALISTFWSPNHADAFRDAAYMCIAVAPAVALGILLPRCYPGVQIAYGLGMLVIPFAVQAAVSAVQRGDSMLVAEGSMRSILASALCLVVPALTGAWALTRKRLFAWLSLIVAILASTMESRSLLLFGLPAAFASLYIQDRQLMAKTLKRWAVPIAVVLLVGGSAIASRFSSESTSLDVGESILEELQTSSEDRVDFDRRLTTFTALTVFMERPLLGGGYASVRQTNQAQYGIDLSAHGLIPGLLGELGVTGIAVLAFIVLRTLRSAVKTIRTPNTGGDPMRVHFLIGFITVLLLGLFHQTIESVFFGIGIGLVSGLTRTSPLKAKQPVARATF